MSLGSLLPPLGETIRCPCCDRLSPALVLTNAYLCPRHGLFEVGAEENGSKKSGSKKSGSKKSGSKKNEVIHLDSGRKWRFWYQANTSAGVSS